MKKLVKIILFILMLPVTCVLYLPMVIIVWTQEEDYSFKRSFFEAGDILFSV